MLQLFKIKKNKSSLLNSIQQKNHLQNEVVAMCTRHWHFFNFSTRQRLYFWLLSELYRCCWPVWHIMQTFSAGQADQKHNPDKITAVVATASWIISIHAGLTAHYTRKKPELFDCLTGWDRYSVIHSLIDSHNTRSPLAGCRMATDSVNATATESDRKTLNKEQTSRMLYQEEDFLTRQASPSAKWIATCLPSASKPICDVFII